MIYTRYLKVALLSPTQSSSTRNINSPVLSACLPYWPRFVLQSCIFAKQLSLEAPWLSCYCFLFRTKLLIRITLTFKFFIFNPILNLLKSGFLSSRYTKPFWEWPRWPSIKANGHGRLPGRHGTAGACHGPALSLFLFLLHQAQSLLRKQGWLRSGEEGRRRRREVGAAGRERSRHCSSVWDSAATQEAPATSSHSFPTCTTSAVKRI